MINNIEFVTYDKQFLDLSWEWLNDSEIKKLTFTPDFSREDQLKWFRSLPYKVDYFIRGIKYGEYPIGACGLKHITNADAEYWGYIGLKEYWGKGIGSVVLKYLEDIGKNVYNISSIYLLVIKNNRRAINLYLKNNYEIESVNDTIYKMRKQL